MEGIDLEPVRHLVLCRFQPGTSADQISAFIEGFRAITRVIPGITAFETGQNNSTEGLSRSLTQACLLTFESVQARDAYLPHPEHRRFVAEYGAWVAEILVFDYIPHP